MSTLSGFVVGKRLGFQWSQAELARRSGVPVTTINRIETGVTKLPGADVRRKIAKALEVSHLELLIEAGEITEAELGTVAGIVEQDPTDPRLELAGYLKRVRLSPDREQALRILLKGLVEADMEGRKP